MFNNHEQDPTRNNSQKNLHTSGRAELITSRAKRMSPWNIWYKDQLMVSRAIYEDYRIRNKT
jgi:hypothetical protein